MSVDIHGPYDL